MNSEPNTDLPPLRGTLGDVKLSIPREKSGGAVYTAARVHYLGEPDWWGSNPKKQYPIPAKDTPIGEFALTLNRRTFRPVESKSDLLSFATSFRPYGDRDLPSESDRWINATFSPVTDSDSAYPLKKLFESQQANALVLLDSMEAAGYEYGLKRVFARNEGGPLQRTVGRRIYDGWYFNDTTWTTLISCMRDSGSVTPIKLLCVHYFEVPEINAVVELTYFAMADVADWKNIETQIRNRALELVVSKPTN